MEYETLTAEEKLNVLNRMLKDAETEHFESSTKLSIEQARGASYGMVDSLRANLSDLQIRIEVITSERDALSVDLPSETPPTDASLSTKPTSASDSSDVIPAKTRKTRKRG